MIDPKLLTKAIAYIKEDLDTITNALVRTYPHGQGVELIKTDSFLSINENNLTNEEQEHATKVFYGNPKSFNIMNFESNGPDLAEQRLVIDTVSDLDVLEKLNSQNKSIE